MQESPLTLRSIFDRMRTVHADAEVVDVDGRRTYGELAERVLRLCRVLTDDLGVRPGDRVASFAYNSARHLELYWAVPLVGAVLHTVNVRLFDEQIAYIVDHAGDRLVFADDALAEHMATIAAGVPCVERTITLGDEYEALLAAAMPVHPEALPDVPETAGFGLCYTSGTTGMPKGVLHSHRAMYLHAMGTCMADSIGLREHDRVLPIVPMFHAFGWGLPYAAALTGAELLLHGADSSPEAVGSLIERERATVAAAVPTIWKDLLPSLRAGAVEVSSLRLVFVGGSASPRALIEAYDDLGIEYLQVWGMTETGPLACASRPRRRHRGLDRDALLDVREKTGTILPGVEARVVADDGTELPLDGTTVGELEVRGPWIASAYYRDEGGDRFHDGWLRTGDMASMERDGYFRIVDRAKDLVKSGGEWISSVELEGHLLGHPDVHDAAVVGVPSKRWDERPVAVVVAANGVVPSLESVRDFLAPKVAKWWLPDLVVPVDAIPKTSVGKLDKKALRAQLAGVELP
ncbi:MAG: long-chain-fatty-acid--CoA ligase [Microthrixaceae bacterium]